MHVPWELKVESDTRPKQQRQWTKPLSLLWRPQAWFHAFRLPVLSDYREQWLECLRSCYCSACSSPELSLSRAAVPFPFGLISRNVHGWQDTLPIAAEKCLVAVLFFTTDPGLPPEQKASWGHGIHRP